MTLIRQIGGTVEHAQLQESEHHPQPRIRSSVSQSIHTIADVSRLHLPR